MNRYEKIVEDRKVLVARLSELTGLESYYTRMPRCAYEIGPFTVERDGTLAAEDGADERIIKTLICENLIRAVDEPEKEAGLDMSTQDYEAERLGELSEPLHAEIAFPLTQHNANSIVNLVCMLYSRGQLLSKATGGEFYADRELVDALLDHPTFASQKEAVDFLRSKNDQEHRLAGLSFDEEKVTFDGFGEVRDPDHLQTFMKLATAMNKMALTQKRVQAREINGENEKYALRVWLIRLGMNGAEYKEDRKRLMKNLSGHTAFRSEEDKARWTVRQAAKRKAHKAGKTTGQPAEADV